MHLGETGGGCCFSDVEKYVKFLISRVLFLEIYWRSFAHFPANSIIASSFHNNALIYFLNRFIFSSWNGFFNVTHFFFDILQSPNNLLNRRSL